MYFAVGLRWLGFANYLFVWGAVFLLGYAWLDDRFSERTLLIGAAGGFSVLLLLVHIAPYPISMIGVPAIPSAPRHRPRSH
jgi:uncharacterized membrane protein YagU involved in acid resistance